MLPRSSISSGQESERYSSNVIDTMGIEQLARFGDSDISAAVIRIPSVTIQDDRFIFIRGMGGRYITTNLNGANLPSTNPSKRSVPLDLFPSNLVEQLDVKKTFVASMPGETTGGNLVINTRSFPAEREGKLSFSLGGVTGLTGNDVLTDPNSGNYDFLGWDDGSRREPAGLVAINETIKYKEFYPKVVETELGRLGGLQIKDNWDPSTGTANPTSF